MSRLPSSYELAIGPLNDDGPLHRQLYVRLHEAILSRRLAPGARLPSSRALAVQLGLSRNTVITALDQLAAEGMLELRRGSGTYVALGLNGLGLRRRQESAIQPARAARAVQAVRPGLMYAALRPFRPNVPALDLFPLETWARITAASWRSATREMLSYNDPRGYRPLREALASYLSTARGVMCDPDQIIVLSGAQQAIYLAARALLNAGDPVAVEDPFHPGARWAFTAAGARVIPVPVDEHGFSVQAARRQKICPKLVYVTPSNQAPLAITMPFQRRQELLSWAEEIGACVLEDDYDSEFRYVSRPIPALHGLSPSSRVIYVGTFSKVLAPALRIGYMVVPRKLVEPLVALRAAIDHQAPTIDHAAAAEFITSGYFARHIRRMRNIYGERREAMLASAERHLTRVLRIDPPDAGLHVIGWLCKGRALSAVERVRRAGLEAYPIRWQRPKEAVGEGLILGFGPYRPAEIERAARRLAEILDHCS
jgi:GntR family transcriptional regulator/MocR family aminotransferase